MTSLLIPIGQSNLTTLFTFLFLRMLDDWSQSQSQQQGGKKGAKPLKMKIKKSTESVNVSCGRREHSDQDEGGAAFFSDPKELFRGILKHTGQTILFIYFFYADH